MRKFITRRKFVGGAAAVGLGSAIALTSKSGLAKIPRRRRPKPKPAPQPLDPTLVQKWENPLINPLGDSPIPVLRPGNNSSLELTIQRVRQDLGLNIAGHRGKLPATPVWGYNVTAHSANVAITNSTASATYPGATFEIQRGTTVTVTYQNGLNNVAYPDSTPIDTTLHWADPGGLGGIAPIPVVTHLHGARTNTVPDDNGRSDGGPTGWFTPGDTYVGQLFTKPYTYQNDQEAGFLWYHDHALGVTRINVYQGLAGAYFLRDNNENALRDSTAGAPVLPSYPYEVPLIIQDRMFQTDGTLFYPYAMEPDPEISAPNPTHLPEFFGDVIMVNSRAWPQLEVEPRKYRFRFLNGSDSRFYELSFQQSDGTKLPILVIGDGLGLLNTPVRANLPATPSAEDGGSPNAGAADTLLLATAERYDVIVDFSSVPFGSTVTMMNSAPGPYPGGDPVVEGLTDRIVKFAVTSPFNDAIPEATVAEGTQLRGLSVPAPATPVLASDPLNDPSIPPVAKTRKIFLFEGTDGFGRLMTMIGVVGADQGDGSTGTMLFTDPITEKPTAGTSEIWELYNFTEDAHPIHIHLIDFRIISREGVEATLTAKTNTDGSDGAFLDPATITYLGNARGPDPFESGKKDTVIAYSGEVTRLIANFDRPGDFVYHCHILSHEDHEMMRPFQVQPANA